MSKLKLPNLTISNPDITDTADYKRAARDMVVTGRGFLVDGKRVDPARVMVLEYYDVDHDEEMT